MATTAARTVVKSTRMDAVMTQAACDTAQAAILECETEKDIAAYIKAAFEEQYGNTWHCFVGANFGAFVTHEEGRAIYFYIGQCGFFLFMTR